MIVHHDDEGPRFVRQRPWWAWPAVLALSVAMTLGLAVDRLASTGRRSIDTAGVAQAIQKERARATLRNCLEQNVRHHNTIETLDQLVANLPPAKRAEAEAGAAQFKFIINAIVPVRDCNALVRRTVVEGNAVKEEKP